MNLTKEIQVIKKNQMEIVELENKITKIKNSLDGFNKRIETRTEERESVNLNRGKEEERKEQSLWGSICIIGVPEGREESGSEEVLKAILAQNLPNLAKDINLHIQETA